MFEDIWNELRILDKKILFTILVAALGYFVDVYDLLIFSAVRVPSLKALNVPDSELLANGIYLINMQLIGILIGGFAWGVLGDKYGRLSVLLGSILLYSLANIANAFVGDVTWYAALRLAAGIGLAGELGVGITLVSELLPIRLRGIGSAFLGTVGMTGAVLAGFLGDVVEWRVAYGIGGGMGLVLLIMRIGLSESKIYQNLAKNRSDITRGNLLKLFTSWRLFRKYVAIFLIPLPELAAILIMVTYTPEFSAAFGAVDPLKAGRAIMYFYIGMTVGDGFSGLLSQALGSRRTAIAIFLAAMALSNITWLLMRPTTPELFYGMCLVIGITGGYWIVAIQLGAEQFGTNLRATAATSIPTIARALIIPIAAIFKTINPSLGIIASYSIIMGMVLFISFLCLRSLNETFYKDLDYVE